MTVLHDSRPAFGRPGIAPRWTQGAKDAVGTAYSASIRLWFTSSAGIVTEIYHPTIDKPRVPQKFRDFPYKLPRTLGGVAIRVKPRFLARRWRLWITRWR